MQVAQDSQFTLKVLFRDGSTYYEKIFDKMIDAWLLTRDKFIYMESFGSRAITCVKLYALVPDSTEIKQFILPEDVEVKRTLTATLEPLIKTKFEANRDSIEAM